MADPKHLKVQPLGSGDGDPLSELTRIMGMNTPSAALRDVRPDDYGIDLERELLGDLGANDSRPSEPASVRTAAPAAARSFVAPSNDSWKAAFSDVVPIAQPQAGPSPRPAAPSAEPRMPRHEPADARPPMTAAAPAPAAQAPGSAEEDPFERLAAFSRLWLDRSDAAAGGGRAAGAGFRMPDQPAGPASPVPPADRRAAAAVAPAQPSAPASVAASMPAEPPSATAPRPTGAAQAAAPASEVRPQPAAAAEEKIFDPFAELVAMAGIARQAPAAPQGPASVVPQGPAGAQGVAAAPREPAPAAAPGRSAPAVPLRADASAAAAAAAPEAGLHGQAFVTNPSIIARRTNWQSVSGAVSREPSPSAAASAVPAAAAVVAAAPAAAEPAASVSGMPVSGPAADMVPPLRPEEPSAAVATDPTWDAISAWVSRPSDRSAALEEFSGGEHDDLDDFFRTDPTVPIIVPPVARIPDLEPEESAPEELAGFGDDFDLESLLRSELEGEGLRPGAGRSATDAADLAGGREPPAEAPAASNVPSAPPVSIGSRDEPRSRPAASAGEGDEPAHDRDDDGMPEVDTVEVPTAKYVVADELDLPELAVEADVPPAVAADDIDADFGGGFEDRGETRPAAGVDTASVAPADGWSRVAPRRAVEEQRSDVIDDLDDAFDEAVRSWADSESMKGIEPDRPAAPAWLSMRPDPRAVDEDDGFDPGYQPVPLPAPETRTVQRSRGFMVAAVVAGVAVAGGIGAFVLSLGGGGDDQPVLVRVDPEPVKIKPEQPGGATVPNQDKAVYERFGATDGAAQPSQERLLSAEEEPVNLAVRTVPITAPAPMLDPVDADSADELPEAFVQGDDAAAPKSEDRVEPADGVDGGVPKEVAVVTPRRVRTMVVRPDGTMVPREEPEAEPIVSAIAEPAPEAPAPLAQAPIRTSDAAPPAAADPASAAPAAEPPAEVAAAQLPPVRRVETSTITREQPIPARGPVAPTRPVDQPVEIVGTTAAAQPTQVAAAQPAPVVASQSSEWAMQIASQPTPEGAQASYADLSRRFGSVLNGRGVNIVKAEVAGKGTFWRVRIPTGSRADANALCERYKAAGGSCFVSK